MVEPLTFGAASSAAGLFSGFYQHFKPARSPYLLGGLLCVICLSIVSGRKELAFSIFVLMLIPMAGTLTLLSLLCFWFDPKRSLQNTEMKGVLEGGFDEKEIDEQYKFSRTLCLSGGIVLLTILFYVVSKIAREPTDSLFFWITYFAALVHLFVFVIYITFRNIQEEKIINLSLFQITFFTVSVLAGLVVAGGRIESDFGLRNGSLIYRCEAGLGPVTKSVSVVRSPDSSSLNNFSEAIYTCDQEKITRHLETLRKKVSEGGADSAEVPQQSITISKNKVLFWYFLFHVLLFESFWIRRLRQIVEVKIVG